MTIKVGEIACFAVTVGVINVVVVKGQGFLLLNLVHYSSNVYAY